MAEEYISEDALTGLYGGDTTSVSGITSLLTPFKGIFDRLKSGSTTANDVNAALGVLGLIMPSLNRPQTKGWKGSIDLTKQYNRAPIAQPAFTPYAQSASPVMGRQFFNTTYGAAPVAPPPTTPDPTIPAPGVPPVDSSVNIATDGGGMARGGIASLRRFDAGGEVNQSRPGPQFYDYHVGANARLVDVPGIKYPVLMFFDLPNNRVVVSDEGYWNPTAPIGEDLNKAVAWARDQGLQAGVVVSPYSWEGFGKDTIGEKLSGAGPNGNDLNSHPRLTDPNGNMVQPASFDQLKEYMDAADFVVTDPYVVSAQTATPGVQEKLIQITGMIGDYAQETNKPAWLVLGGGVSPTGTDPNMIYNYTDSLLANTANKFNQVSVYESERDSGDTGNTWDYLKAADIFAKNGIQLTGNYGTAFETRQSIAPTPALNYDISSLKVGSVQDFLNGPNLQDPSNWGRQTAYLDPASALAKAISEQQTPQQQPQQPAALTGLAGSLPSGWSGYDAGQKIDWYNQNQVTPDQLLGAGAGVTQGDIDWMKGQGYLGSYGQQNPVLTATSHSDYLQSLIDPRRTIQEESTQMPPVGFPVTQTGISQLSAPQLPMPQPMPQPEPPRFPMSELQPDEVMAAQGGMMGYARGGRANRPRYLRGETDGMQDRIPSNIDGVQPAKLSHGEFVIPADVVSHLGNGNSDAGAKVLYKMMDRVRHARTGNKKQGKQINPEKFTPGGIAGYAGGGAVAFNAGGAAPAPPTAPLGASNEQNISEWAGPYVGDMLSKTSALTNTPYQAYQGPMVAGTAPLQSKVFGGLESLNFPGQLGQSFTSQGAYQLPSMTPGGMTGQATGPTGIASQYMNPYLSAVLTPQLDELRRQSQITQMGTASKLAQAGAFGGSRQAIMDAETQRNLLQEQNKAIGTGYANAYDRAMGQFNTEQGQAKTLADMMAGAGQQQRGIEQEGITALQKQYETELLDPYTKLRFQKEMLQGLPVATASTTANTSQLGEAQGNFGSLLEALKKLGLG
jgi:hypothetical protein